MTYQQVRTKLLKSSLITRERVAKKIFIHRLIEDAARAMSALTLLLVSRSVYYPQHGHMKTLVSAMNSTGGLGVMKSTAMCSGYRSFLKDFIPQIDSHKLP